MTPFRPRFLVLVGALVLLLHTVCTIIEETDSILQLAPYKYQHWQDLNDFQQDASVKPQGRRLQRATGTSRATRSRSTGSKLTEKSKEKKGEDSDDSDSTSSSSSDEDSYDDTSGTSTSTRNKIAIYMTTSASSPKQRGFLLDCWPTALQRFPSLLSQADLIVYTSSQSAEDDQLFTQLGFPKVTFHRFQERHYSTLTQQPIDSKQDGAIRAMVDPFLPQDNWFHQYDWIIRMNPDVLIRNDTWLLQTMHNQSIDAILGHWTHYNTHYNNNDPHNNNNTNGNNDTTMLLTDFHAFRPRAVNHTALFNQYQQQELHHQLHAESHLYAGFSHLQHQGRIAWIPHIEFPGMEARIGGEHCDIIHDHHLQRLCPNYMDYHLHYRGNFHYSQQEIDVSPHLQLKKEEIAAGETKM
ncbi:expressed unknown protein [Seminavis robusta]|uniref:Uncharacterized protein n=1 Tax=Seminavis robusta TaxID=568900 RepID=A0A9N8ENU8_9STRA|nr:expressed unknown protein [Seminavis robusta]|eukprot:Sro1547_g281500.1 n/a (410) ;mRNA; r:16201-17430